MLNINKLINTEIKALETTYLDTVTVTRNEDVEEGNITKNRKIEILVDEPCALSIDKNISPNVKNTNGTTEIEGNYVLFLSKAIKEGDMLKITRQNEEEIIAIAGKPSFHTTHYEVSILVQERA